MKKRIEVEPGDEVLIKATVKKTSATGDLILVSVHEITTYHESIMNGLLICIRDDQIVKKLKPV